MTKTTHFNGPVVKCSESEAVSTSTGLVASVTWLDLRYPCSLAGKNSSATVAQHLDGNRLRATLAPNVGLEGLSIPVSFSENRLPSMEREDSRAFPSERLESQPRWTSFSEYRFPSDGLGSQSVWSSFPQNRPNALDCQPIQTSLPENRSRTVRLQNPAVEVDRRRAVESAAMSKDVESLTATDDPSRQVSASFLTAIAAKVNALWRAFHSKTPVAPLRADTTKHVDEMHVFRVTRDDRVETYGQTA